MTYPDSTTILSSNDFKHRQLIQDTGFFQTIVQKDISAGCADLQSLGRLVSVRACCRKAVYKEEARFFDDPKKLFYLTSRLCEL